MFPSQLSKFILSSIPSNVWTVSLRTFTVSSSYFTDNRGTPASSSLTYQTLIESPKRAFTLVLLPFVEFQTGTVHREAIPSCWGETGVVIWACPSTPWCELDKGLSWSVVDVKTLTKGDTFTFISMLTGHKFLFFPIYAGVGRSSFCNHWTRISLFFYSLSLGDCLPNNQSIVVCPFTTFQQSSTLMDLSFSQLFIGWFPWHTPHFDWKVVKASLLDLLSSLLILPLAASPLAYSEDFIWYSDSSVIQSLRSLSHSRGLCSFTHL